MSNKQRIAELLAETSRRDRELFRCYTPSKTQEAVHRSRCSELIVRGGKRAGKSVSVSAEFVSRITGEPVTDEDGKPISTYWKAKEPAPDYPRIFWIIGWDTKHIGQTIYRLLFAPGQGGSYRVIQDLNTGMWRAYNRADPSDSKRIKESKLSEPLIPERLLDGGYEDAFEWENKKAYQFNSFRLKNGATVFAYPSSARNPKQGDAVSGIWIDEDVQFPGHLKEWQDRLTDEEGWFMWSVWPHMKNEALLDLINRSEMAKLEKEPQIESVQLIMTENPYLTDKGKRESLGRMESEEEMQRRNRGELLLDSRSMYQFSNSIHCIKRPIEGQMQLYEMPPAHKYLQDMWLEMNGFPREWTRYLAIDPSNTRTAVLSFAIPPLEWDGVNIGQIAIVEWEIIARRASAAMLAKMCWEKIGTKNYEAFIMDQMAGRQTHAGREDNTFGVYSAAFREQKLVSRQTHYSFAPGCNVRSTRFQAVRAMLNTQMETGLPQLMIVEETCPETKREFGKYMKKTEARGEGVDSVLDEPANPRLYDCMAALEYGCAYLEPLFIMGQGYVHPSNYRRQASPVMQRVKKIMEKQGDSEGVVYLGGNS